jgi:glycosyltransferase involved in cell wall biosynthesis
MPRADHAPVVVAVANHHPRKGVDVLLHALHALKQAGVLFFAQLVGSGTLLETHRRLAQSLHLSDCIQILGRVESVDEYLANADLFVLPSREEQSGSLALLEAMRAGVACVASSCDGIPEDVRHKVDAWLSTPGDPASLATGISELISNPGLRAAIARTGQRTFEEKFSSGAFTANLDRIYSDVLDARDGASRAHATAPSAASSPGSA